MRASTRTSNNIYERQGFSACGDYKVDEITLTGAAHTAMKAGVVVVTMHMLAISDHVTVAKRI